MRSSTIRALLDRPIGGAPVLVPGGLRQHLEWWCQQRGLDRHAAASIASKGEMESGAECGEMVL